MSKRVEVYYNLHKKCLSVRDKKTKRVIDHVENIRLTNCRFIVQPAGRHRVIETGRKNVHAWVEGTIPDEWRSHGIAGRARRASYNPYRLTILDPKPYFYDVETGKPVRECSQVEIVGKVIWYD